MRRIALLLTVAIGTVSLLAFFYPSIMVNAADTTPPETIIDSGPSGTFTGTTATFTFHSTETGSKFKCKLIGQESTRTTCTSPKSYTNFTGGTTYTFKVWAKDAAGNIDPTPATRTFTPSGGSGDTDGDGVPDSTDQCPTQPGPPPGGCPPATSSAVLVGAGDISSGGDRDQDTGDLIRTQLNQGAWGVFTTGDNAYPDGISLNYEVYGAAWGSFKNKTRPTYGNHDYYGDLDARDSAEYWNEAPPDPTPVQVSNTGSCPQQPCSYYAYNVGNSNWRAIVLNSVSTEGPKNNLAPDCKPGSAQHNFLLSELASARTNNKNTVLFWHHARFSSSTDHPTSEGETGCSDFFFDTAHDNGADLVVQGHSHIYERYHTRDTTGAKNVTSGLTSIVCGTGGNSFDGLQSSPSPVPDKRFTNAWGVCKLTLDANSAQVQYLAAPNSVEPGTPPDTDSATIAVRP